MQAGGQHDGLIEQHELSCVRAVYRKVEPKARSATAALLTPDHEVSMTSDRTCPRLIATFTAGNFTPTKWDKAEKKVWFARQFIRFVNADFHERHFTQPFYQRLSLCFGHIAHFNRHGFFQTFFVSTEGKVRFLRQTLQYPCWGDPAFTYSDVERPLQACLRKNRVLEHYEQKLADEQEAAERAELARLQAKYPE
jgi:hypothetical protein